MVNVRLQILMMNAYIQHNRLFLRPLNCHTAFTFVWRRFLSINLETGTELVAPLVNLSGYTRSVSCNRVSGTATLCKNVEQLPVLCATTSRSLSCHIIIYCSLLIPLYAIPFQNVTKFDNTMTCILTNLVHFSFMIFTSPPHHIQVQF